MGAPKGNSYWRLAKGFAIGTQPKYKPEELKVEIPKYFEWIDENPLYETVVQKIKISRDEEEIQLVAVPKMRPYTVGGLQLFLGITNATWSNYKKKKAYINVITCAEEIIYGQKFEGSASGFFNASIIARDLGLKEKTETTVIEQPLFGGDEENEEDDE